MDNWFGGHFDANLASRSIGSGNIMVEFFSAEIVLRVWRYRSWIAAGDWAITSAASFKARDAFCSPSAAITYYIGIKRKQLTTISWLY